jgi:ligand-binding sensor domain-containing protein
MRKKDEVVYAWFRGFATCSFLLSWTIVVIVVIVVPRVALCAPVPIWAHFTTENSDLPNNSVLALARDSEGSLWVGTAGGLARLDKEGHWQTYTMATSNGGLPDDRVQAVVASDGVLWAGTQHGLARLDKNGRWQTYTKANTDGRLPSDSVTALAVGPDGALWIGTRESQSSRGSGVVRLDKDGHWQTFTRDNTNSLMWGNVRALAPASDGALWVAMDFGLVRRDNTGHWRSYLEATMDTPDVSPTALAVASDGVLWVANRPGLMRFDKEPGYKVFFEVDSGLPGDNVQALAIASDGALWAGTYAGLARLDKNGNWQTYTSTNTNGSLPDNDVVAVAGGSDGAVWIGTKSGLTRLDVEGGWQTYTKSNTGDALPSDRVLALTVSPEGALWVGTDRGLARLDNEGHWRTYTAATGDLPDDKVQALAIASDGVLWAGTQRGLARLDKNGRWQTYTKENTGGGLPTDSVGALAFGSDGALWVGTQITDGPSGGIARLDKNGQWQTYTTDNIGGGLGRIRIEALTFDSDGALWVGATTGLARLGSGGHWRTYAGDARAFAPAAHGVLWVGTGLRGVARLDREGHWQTKDWQTYRKMNRDRGPFYDAVAALTFDPDGGLWVGMSPGGVARRDKDGQWQTYTKANTNSGLPNDDVSAVAFADGSLWVGTRGGIARLKQASKPTHAIVNVIGNSGKVVQHQQTLAVVAFDRSYRTRSDMFRYVWRVREEGARGEVAGEEVNSRSPIYKAEFKDNGTYRVRVFAVDRYGMWSEPKELTFEVTTPQPNPLRDLLIKLGAALASAGLFYFVLIFPLIPLYPRFSWARTAANSGVFTKFPFLHKAVLNSAWARRHLFRRIAKSAASASLPSPYITQSLFAAKQNRVEPITLDGSRESLNQLFASQRRALLIARSGTGKSVLLRYLQREVANRLLTGEEVPVPVLIDLRTHVLSGRKVQDLIRDTLRKSDLELSDADLDFLIWKGGFLILVDSLNELPNIADARLFHTFLNQDPHNLVLIASQQDLIGRDDVHLFNLAEITPKQAAKYLTEATGRDLYSTLPAEAQALARNPQDLALLAEVSRALGTGPIPTRRAELYREILAQDGALRAWVKSGDVRLTAIYALAFRMVSEQHVLQEDQLREWIEAEVGGGDAVDTIIRAIEASGLFITEMKRDVLGKERPVTGFRHELIGKFLASRHVRRSIARVPSKTKLNYVLLSGDELWSDVFYFAVDEIDALQLNRFLSEILSAGGSVRMRIAAYAIGTKKLAEPSGDLRQAYADAKLKEDLAMTPAT